MNLFDFLLGFASGALTLVIVFGQYNQRYVDQVAELQRQMRSAENEMGRMRQRDDAARHAVARINYAVGMFYHRYPECKDDVA